MKYCLYIFFKIHIFLNTVFFLYLMLLSDVTIQYTEMSVSTITNEKLHAVRCLLSYFSHCIDNKTMSGYEKKKLYSTKHQYLNKNMCSHFFPWNIFSILFFLHENIQFVSTVSLHQVENFVSTVKHSPEIYDHKKKKNCTKQKRGKE